MTCFLKVSSIILITGYALLFPNKTLSEDDLFPNGDIFFDSERQLSPENPIKIKEDTPLFLTLTGGPPNHPFYGLKTFSELESRVNSLLILDSYDFQGQPLLPMVLESVLPRSAAEAERLFKIVSHIVAQQKTRPRQSEKGKSLLKTLEEIEYIKTAEFWYGEIFQLLLKEGMLTGYSNREKTTFITDFLKHYDDHKFPALAAIVKEGSFPVKKVLSSLPQDQRNKVTQALEEIKKSAQSRLSNSLCHASFVLYYLPF